MAEYIEREALLAFLDGNHDDRDWLVNQYNADWICSWIESQPAADVQPVVHCYQCKYYTKSMMLCNHEDGLDTPDKRDFCSYGEKWGGE